MRILTGGLIAGVILYFVPGLRSSPACLIAGAMLAWLVLQLGPRSIVEKVGVVAAVGLIAWTAGPRAAYGQSFLWYLCGWLAAGAALAYHLHPKAE